MIPSRGGALETAPRQLRQGAAEADPVPLRQRTGDRQHIVVNGYSSPHHSTIASQHQAVKLLDEIDDLPDALEQHRAVRHQGDVARRRTIDARLRERMEAGGPAIDAPLGRDPREPPAHVGRSSAAARPTAAATASHPRARLGTRNPCAGSACRRQTRRVDGLHTRYGYHARPDWSPVRRSSPTASVRLGLGRAGQLRLHEGIVSCAA